MTTLRSDPSTDRQARLTGALYLVIIVCALFGQAVVRSSVIVPGDATATAARILESELLFRLVFLGDLIAFLADVAVAALLYVLLRPAGRLLALTSSAFRLVGTAIYGANLLNHLAAMTVLDGGAVAGAQPESLALLFLEIHGLGYDLGLVFFGVHCILLGWLLVRSPAFARWLGWLMVAAGLVYVAGSTTVFLAPAQAGALQPFYAVPLAGELALTLWLLIRGARSSSVTPA
jgi:hypothetical protein